jgi:hypothetical protein
MMAFHSELRGDFFTRDTIGYTGAARGGIPPFRSDCNEGNPMSKTRDSKKQTKKTALKSPQQKRDAKREKRTRR